MPNAQIILGLLLAVVVLTTVARQLGIAYPVVLVIGGLVLSFFPGMPQVALPPDLVLILFLPPLLYWESINLSYRDLREGIQPILNLAIGLVFATIVAVAAVAHAILPNFTWALAFVLGTIVGPTDEVAVSEIAQRLPLPARLLALIEDESLLNDATSLVAYTVAVAAVVTGTFSLWSAAVEVVVAAVGGIAIGVVVGWGAVWIRSRLDDPPVENTISLLTGFAAYLPANALHLSGVLAAVACGIYVSRRSTSFISPRTRLQGGDMWEIVDFLLNGILFVLVGLQLHGIVSRLSLQHPEALAVHAVIIVLTVIVLRIVWVFAFTYVPRFLFPAQTVTWRDAPWQETAIVAWTGIRGAVSLAAALAIPLTVNGGGVFPQRDLIIFETFAVILATLVLQGLTFPLLIERLGIAPGQEEQYEETAARSAATQAGLEALNSSARDGLPEELIEGLRRLLEARSQEFATRVRSSSTRAERTQRAQYRRLVREVLGAERDALVDLRDQDIISDDVLSRVVHELDLDEIRLEPDDGDPGQEPVAETAAPTPPARPRRSRRGRPAKRG